MLCRHLNEQNLSFLKTYSSVTREAPPEVGDTVDCAVGFEEEYPDIPCELIELFEDDKSWLEDEDSKTPKRLKPEILKEKTISIRSKKKGRTAGAREGRGRRWERRR